MSLILSCAPTSNLLQEAHAKFRVGATPISLFCQDLTYEEVWENALRFPLNIELENSMETLSIWKRQLDPNDAAAMPFPKELLTPAQIKAGIDEDGATNLYKWMNRRSSDKNEYGQKAEYIEKHFL